jgi:hypothetical protein
MDREYESQHTSSPAAVTTQRHTIEPGQATRSALLRKPDRAIASGLIQQKKLEAAAVQRKADAPDVDDIHDSAAQGIAGAATTLPFLDRIQQAFGAHDVGGIEAHVGGPATQACHDIGALAYATGNHVAFREAPDLHTTAHEAAHVIQQRAGVQLAGGVGQEGDAYERHADQVADAVVAGRSAEALLGGGGTRKGDAPGEHAACPKCGSSNCGCGKPSGTQRKTLQQRVDPEARSSQPVQREPAGGAAGADPAAAPAASGKIVDDPVEPGPGQMRKGAFLGALRGAAQQAISAQFPDPITRAMATAQVEPALASAQGQSAQALEANVLQHAPEAAGAGSAAEYIPLLIAKTQQSAGGDGGAGGAGGAGSGDRVARKARGTADPEVIAAPAIRAQLGQGSALDRSVQAKMEQGFGVDFSGVQLHTDHGAARIAERIGASAFSVGEHIAFAQGEYRPGTREGDTLLAHELAHVVQARGGGAHSAASEHALEADADAAAESVVSKLWRRARGGARQSGKGPQLKSGLRVQRRVVNYHLQNQTGFPSCVYCICTREPGVEPKELFTMAQVHDKCPPGLAVDIVPSSCGGNGVRSRTPLSENPCPDSTTMCL